MFTPTPGIAANGSLNPGLAAATVRTSIGLGNVENAAASTLYVGLTGNQTVAGNKTFSGNVVAASLSESGAAATGTGGLVRATSPSLVTPSLGAATGESLSLLSFANQLQIRNFAGQTPFRFDYNQFGDLAFHCFGAFYIVTGTEGVIVFNNRPLSCGNLTASGTMSVGTYTVATLPSASANAGRFAQVTDSNSTTNGSTVAGSGSNRVPVFSNGTNWIIK
jgi:hypothetical protein